MFKLTIKLPTWLRGEGIRKSYLLRESDGKRCCVGIYARALGVPDEKLLGKKWPDFSPGRKAWHAEEAPWLWGDTGLSEANDDRFSEANKREATIEDIFAKNGVEVTFED